MLMSDGVLLFNKPTGISSAKAVAVIKSLFAAKKVGHGGTLDPTACGLLLVMLGSATAFARFALTGKKSYCATLIFGQQTDTDDSEGNTIFSGKIPENLEESLNLILPMFIGKQEQTSPTYCALKHDGKPLYDYARKGLTVPLKKRQVVVHSLAATDISEKTATLNIVCGGGFYVRALARDIGKKLGCGAYLHTLQRSAVGDFNLSSAISPTVLETKTPTQRMDCLLPVSSLVSHLPACRLSGEEIFTLASGGGVFAEDGIRQIFSPQGRFAGIATGEQKLLKATVFLPWTRRRITNDR